jgi:hypothetical protein
MNFIKHFRGWRNQMTHDERLSPAHVSLYETLFHYWNLNYFKNPVSINRAETMGAAKIRAPNHYAKCLRELDQWGYLIYEPSANQILGSIVHMHTFSTPDSKSKNIPATIPADILATIPADLSADIPPDIPATIPSINTTNTTNNLNNSNFYGTRIENSNFNNSGWTPHSTSADHTAGDPERQTDHRGGGPGGRPESFAEVETFFREKGCTAKEAGQFFTHYNIIGWVYGKMNRPVHNWHYAADKWIDNIKPTQHESIKPRPGASHVPRGIDYKKPL